MKKAHITEDHIHYLGRSVLPVVRDGIEMLKREIDLCRPNVIIALGNAALWALTGQWGITKWRGSELQCQLQLNLPYKPKVLPVLPPKMVLQQWPQRRIAVQDLRRAAKNAKDASYNPPAFEFRVGPSFGLTMTLLERLTREADRGPLKLAVDIETRAGHIACVGIAWSKLEALCIPLMSTKNPLGYWEAEQEAQILHSLYRLMTHTNSQVVGQNFLYDAQYFYRHLHYVPNLVRDTMLAHHACFSNLQKGLDFLSSMYCDFHVYWKDEGKLWDGTNEYQFWKYNCQDAVITYEVDEEEQRVVDKMKLREVHDFQQKLFWPVLRSMILGMRIDHELRERFRLQIEAIMREKQQQIDYIVGHPLNVRSAPQMQKLFYDDMKQRPMVNRKTGSISCDDESLGKIVERQPILGQLVSLISDLRSLGVFRSTFILAPLDDDHRMRTSFNIAGAETYRFSSSENAFGSGLNFQNLPKGDGGNLPNIRRMFIPDEGMEMFDIDLSAADLRIVVWEADEPAMKQMLKEGKDPYTEIAKEFYKDQTITKKDPRRQTFKSFAHGTNYLGTAKGLAERLGLSIKEAESTQKWYFTKFPKIKKWQDTLRDQVYRTKVIKNPFGYRCYINDRIEGTVFNQAAAWIPQSAVACLINRAYVRIYEELPEVQILCQVHDSLVGQYPIEKAEFYRKEILRCATIPLPYKDDPLIIPVGIATSAVSWGDCK